MLATVDPWFVVNFVVAIVAVVLGVAAACQARTLGRVRASLAAAPDADLGATAARLRAELDERDNQLVVEREATTRLLEAVGPGVITVGPDLHIVEANPVAHTLLGRAPGGLLGRTVLEAFSTRPSRRPPAGRSTSVPRRPRSARRCADGPTIVIRGDARRRRRVAVPRGRLRVPPAPADPRGVHRQPVARAGGRRSRRSAPAETLSREAAFSKIAIPDRMRDRIGKIEVETGHLVQMVNELLDLSRIESGGTLQLVDGIDLGGWRPPPPSACTCSPSAKASSSGSTSRPTSRRSAGMRPAWVRSSSTSCTTP